MMTIQPANNLLKHQRAKGAKDTGEKRIQETPTGDNQNSFFQGFYGNNHLYDENISP
jgi:hypothetical protein